MAESVDHIVSRLVVAAMRGERLDDDTAHRAARAVGRMAGRGGIDVADDLLSEHRSYADADAAQRELSRRLIQAINAKPYALSAGRVVETLIGVAARTALDAGCDPDHAADILAGAMRAGRGGLH